jgi:hypothetical protein
MWDCDSIRCLLDESRTGAACEIGLWQGEQQRYERILQ